MKALHRIVLAAPCAILFLLAGCSDQELYGQLTERQANEMVAVLRSAGINADKLAQEGHYAVVTPSRDFPVAVRASASTSRVAVAGVSSVRRWIRARRNGASCTTSPMRKRVSPWTTSRKVPSGCFSALWMRITVPIE